MPLRGTCTLLLTVALPVLAMASGRDKYEVWAVDQSNSNGKTYGGTIYIWDGHALERGHAGGSAVPEKIDLSGAAAELCMAQTGANPVRPHMIAINPVSSAPTCTPSRSGASEAGIAPRDMKRGTR